MPTTSASKMLTPLQMQVAEGQDHVGHYIVGAGRSNEIQATQTQVLVRVCALVQAALCAW